MVYMIKNGHLNIKESEANKYKKYYNELLDIKRQNLNSKNF